MANYTRFSPADWSTSNMSHFNSADNARNNSERIRNEAVRLMRDREDKTVLTQRDADRRIGERLHDVTFWRSELQVIFAIIFIVFSHGWHSVYQADELAQCATFHPCQNIFLPVRITTIFSRMACSIWLKFCMQKFLSIFRY